MTLDSFRQFPPAFQRDILASLVQDRKFLRESLGLMKPEYFEKDLDMRAAKHVFKIFLETKHPPSRPVLMHALALDLEKAARVKDLRQRKILILRPINKLLKRIYRPLTESSAYIQKQSLDFCRVQFGCKSSGWRYF